MATALPSTSKSPPPSPTKSPQPKSSPSSKSTDADIAPFRKLSEGVPKEEVVQIPIVFPVICGPPRALICVVVSARNMSNYKYRSTFNALIALIQTDESFYDVKAELKAWDEENDWEQYSHILLSHGISYVNEFRKFSNWLDGLPEKVQARVFNSIPLIKWNMTKKYLLELKDKGITIPPSVFIEEDEKMTIGEAMVRLEAEKVGKDPLNSMIAKSMVDAGGNTVQKLSFDDDTEANDLVDDYLEEDHMKGTIVQQFLAFIHIEGEWSLMFFDKKFSHAVLKNPGANEIRVQVKHGGAFLHMAEPNIPVDILEFGQKVVEAVEEPLIYARVDIVRNMNQDPCLMELEIFEPELYITESEPAVNFMQAILKY